MALLHSLVDDLRIKHRFVKGKVLLYGLNTLSYIFHVKFLCVGVLGQYICVILTNHINLHIGKKIVFQLST